MAEAHQGVAFAFVVTEEEGLHISVGFETFKAVVLSGYRSWRRLITNLIVIILFFIKTSSIPVLPNFTNYSHSNFFSEFNLKWILSESSPQRHSDRRICHWLKKI